MSRSSFWGQQAPSSRWDLQSINLRSTSCTQFRGQQTPATTIHKWGIYSSAHGSTLLSKLRPPSGSLPTPASWGLNLQLLSRSYSWILHVQVSILNLLLSPWSTSSYYCPEDESSCNHHPETYMTLPMSLPLYLSMEDFAPILEPTSSCFLRPKASAHV